LSDCIKKSIEQDAKLNSSSSLLWKFGSKKPEVRQIYGHFLPPSHMEVVKKIGLVAKDFNFPAAYHAHQTKESLKRLYTIGKEISENTIVSINNRIKVRQDGDGAIVYTPYFNGFYLNKLAYEIIASCEKKTKVKNIAKKLGVALESIVEFLTRIFTLEIINVYPEKA